MQWGLFGLGALAGVIAMLGWAPGAEADPVVGGALIDSPTLGLSDLGSPEPISFSVRHDIARTTLAFPVPQGLAPVALNATLEVPVNLRFGNLRVTQDSRTISRVELPAIDQAQMVIPLAGTQVSGDWVSVTLTMTAIPIEGYCWDPMSPIRLENGSVTFAGTEVAPTTLAGFLAPVLRRLAIALPPKPSQAESDAAVQLAAAMVTRYGWQNLDVVVVPLSEGASTLADPSLTLERQIIIKEGPDKSLSPQASEGVPALLISGPGNELTNQTRLLTDDSLQFARSPKAVAGPLMTEQRPASNTTTLENLNQSALTSEALWPEVGIELDQSRFAHPLDGIRVHLIGSYTPLPNNFGGEVSATVGAQTIGRCPANASGTIDRWVNIPDRLLQRSTTLWVRVRTTGDPGPCSDYLPVTLSIDGSTVIEASSANPPAPPGFQSLPQALMPRIQIGIGMDAFGDTVRAAQIIVGLQKISAVPLLTTVTSLKQAIDSRDPAILISADGWTDKKIALPFSADQGSVTIHGLDTAGKSVTLTLDPAIPFGSLQAVFDGQRSILIATSNGAPAQLNELLGWLSGERGRWSALEGRAIISLPGSEPVTIPNPPTGLQSEASSAGKGYAWVWWIAGGVAAAAVAGALVFLRRTRKSRGSPIDEE